MGISMACAADVLIIIAGLAIGLGSSSPQSTTYTCEASLERCRFVREEGQRELTDEEQLSGRHGLN